MELLQQAREGFQTVEAEDEVREQAAKNLEKWLTDPYFADYRPQLEWLIENKQWSGLLDRFCQVLPFGTGGRRGAVGIGPNRMNRWTLGASVQGHCEYLKERFPGKGNIQVALAYDVRQFEDQRESYCPDRPNPVLHLSSKDLAHYAGGVYVANGIEVLILPPDSDRYMSTPELSFVIRYFDAQGGLNISASHNPSDDNGGKFYDERGGQPVPPEDQIMADLVDQVTTIKNLSWDEAVRTGKVTYFDDEPHKAYIDLCAKQSLIPAPVTDDFKVVFTPLHGVGSMTSLEVLRAQGFRVETVESQMAPDGQFPNVTESPNPEVPESMDKALALAKEKNADLVLSTDPDADRLGGMAPDAQGKWRIINGNEIAAMLTHFKLSKLRDQGRLPGSPIVVCTAVTTSQITEIAHKFNAQIVNNLLVGFKYIAEVIWQLEQSGAYEEARGTPEDFVIASEESHGILLTPKMRDKDAGAAALLMAELALDQKRRNKTTIDYLDQLNRDFGYYRNVGVSVYLRGLEGRQLMSRMLDKLREDPPEEIAGTKVLEMEDLRDPKGRMGEIRGGTDYASRNVLIFKCEDKAKLTLRPSGTEPKAKIYSEVGTDPKGSRSDEEWAKVIEEADARQKKLTYAFAKHALALIGMTPEEAGLER